MEGQTLSHYQVIERLGGGGMGVVYKALDTRLDRHVALKALPPDLTRDDAARQRFVLEAKAASALDHANICTIYGIDQTPDGGMFIAMGYCGQETLKKRIERGLLTVEEALDVATQIAQGLRMAHGSGIVHRDIKPSNVMITEDGVVKIVDFGIAKLLDVTGLTQTGASPGTISYMSPEQIAGEGADQQSDVWALGVVLYEMLTGQLPFKGENQWGVINAISNRTPAPIASVRNDVPPEVENIVLGALEKRREQRFPSTSVFADALVECRRKLTQPTSSAPLEIDLVHAFSRPSIVVPSLLALFLLGIVGVRLVGNGGDAQWAREEAVPEIARLVEENA